MKKRIQLVLKIVLSVTIFILVFLKIFSDQTFNLWSILSLNVIITIILTGIVQILLNVGLQKISYSIYKMHFSFQKLLFHNTISSMYAFIIPGFFAPDVYLGYYFGKQSKNYPGVISSLVVNRFIGTLTSGFLALFALIYLGNSILSSLKFKITTPSYSNILLFAITILTLCCIAYLAFQKKIIGVVAKLKIESSQTLKMGMKFNYILSIKLLFNIAGIVGRYSIGRFIGINLPFLDFACIIILVNVLISLPLSINGIGVREAGYLGLLALFHIPGSLSFTFALGEFGITLFGAMVGFSLWLVHLFLNRKVQLAT